MQKNLFATSQLSKVLTVVSFSCALCFISSCSHRAGGTIEVYETVGYQPNFGPFDSNGNYIDNWADNPPRRKYIPRDKKKSSRPVTPTPVPSPQYVSAAPKPAVQQSPPPRSTAQRSKPKPVTVKPKAKPPRSHTVKKGDTLYGLSRKYGTTVSAIQKANRIKGTTIGIGQRLIIPR